MHACRDALTRRAPACKRVAELQSRERAGACRTIIPSGQKLHHEDLELGKPYDSGSKTVSKEEILAYGRAYDPQPIHVDEEAAKKTLVGGLCASGWHTCAMMMRMVADGLLNHVASLGSPGVDEGRWMVPVRPGDDGHLPLHGARRSATWRRGRTSASPRCWSSFSIRRARRRPTGAPTSSRAGAIQAPRRTPPRRSAARARSPACGRLPAPPARRAPTSSSRTARSAS